MSKKFDKMLKALEDIKTDKVKVEKKEKKVEKNKTKKEKVINADVNGDGKVDEKDVEEVKKKIVSKKD